MAVRWIRRRAALFVTGLAAVVSLAVSTDAGAASGSWHGSLDGFGSSSWRSSWGIDGSGEFGFDRMKVSGGTLDVKYGKGSSAPSCTNCPTGGGAQYYQNLGKAGHDDLAKADTLYLRYQVRFPSDFDFGKGGKLPGLYGGNPGEASGGNHGKAWSTRFMFRNGNDGEVYVYTPAGDGYGKEVGLGSWHFAADGKAHTIQQSVTRSSGKITVWYDGKQVLSDNAAPGIETIPFRGLFFSTFFGGHETSWGPNHEEHAYFSDFAVSTGKL